MENILRACRTLIPEKVFLALQPAYHFTLAFLAALRYGFPGRHLKVIGVTGTKGKTTTVELVHEILAAGGAKVASLSSLRFKIGEHETPNDLKMTMPGRFFVQKFLRDALRAGCSYVILEVTSQGIAQYRHRFIGFSMGVVTNVAPEHIEAHHGFEHYIRAKLDLFWRIPKTGVAIINRDDWSWERFSGATGARKMYYGRDAITGLGRTVRVEKRVIGEKGISFACGDAAITSSLMGEFNFYNILAACAVGLALHINPERIAEGVARVSGVAGRMEFVQTSPFRAVVDYAHTPDSLRSVYQFLRGEKTKNKKSKKKMICVLGAAGGGRDTWKRSQFGRIAAEFCDEVILTDEDPYDEDPEKILESICAGFSGAVPAKKILDRRHAIREALQVAGAGDTVVITGKGAEPWMMKANGEKVPWDDRRVVREEAARVLSSH